MFGLFKKTPKEQQKILFFCGAGVSQESGINTFRDSNGLWENHDIDKVCNFNNFLENKKEVFDFYNERKQDALKAKPNLAHKAIAKIQNTYGTDNVIIFTSNIDNLLTQAGCKDVIHIHGNMFQMQCLNCETVWDIGNSSYNIDSICPQCNSSHIKPFIVFFHEPAPLYKILRETFEKGGPVIKGEIINNIKVIVGTSFKVIKPEAFRLSRGKSIVVDTVMPELKGQKCDKIILKPATQAFSEVNNLIKDWYRIN